jgi:alcohol dehydrogenase (quinone), cytochrome c subunit
VRGGKAFAGGLRMGTPMGVIYSTNITPDPDTGNGNYSRRDFDRAVRSGITKDAHHLYRDALSPMRRSPMRTSRRSTVSP